MEDVIKGNRKYRNLFYLAGGGLITALILTLVVLYLAIFPRATAEVTQPIVVNSNPVNAGSVVDYTISQCRYTDGEAYIERNLVRLTSDEDKELTVPLGNTISKRPTGCYEFSSTNVYIPSGIPSGEYYISLDICYQTTILQRICGTLYTEPFFIISEDDKDNESIKEEAERQREEVQERRRNTPSERAPITGNDPPEASSSSPTTPPKPSSDNSSDNPPTSNTSEEDSSILKVDLNEAPIVEDLPIDVPKIEIGN